MITDRNRNILASRTSRSIYLWSFAFGALSFLRIALFLKSWSHFWENRVGVEIIVFMSDTFISYICKQVTEKITLCMIKLMSLLTERKKFDTTPTDIITQLTTLSSYSNKSRLSSLPSLYHNKNSLMNQISHYNFYKWQLSKLCDSRVRYLI